MIVKSDFRYIQDQIAEVCNIFNGIAEEQHAQDEAIKLIQGSLADVADALNGLNARIEALEYVVPKPQTQYSVGMENVRAY